MNDRVWDPDVALHRRNGWAEEAISHGGYGRGCLFDMAEHGDAVFHCSRGSAAGRESMMN